MVTTTAVIDTGKSAGRNGRKKAAAGNIAFIKKNKAGRHGVEDYRGLAAPELFAEIEMLAGKLKGLHVVHVNATPKGGGVAEILDSLVPLSRSAGINAEWLIIPPEAAFNSVTKNLHHHLQGAAGHPGDAQMEHYLSHNNSAGPDLAKRISGETVCVIHDPQPLPLIDFLPDASKAVWNCHIDTTGTNASVRDTLVPFIRRYRRAVFSREQYILGGLDTDKIHVFAPAIDPLVLKNRAMPPARAGKILAGLGIEPHRPLVTQVSRFDQWKDPWGVIDAFRIARRCVPGLQLALVGTLVAQDDPDSKDVLLNVWQYAGGDPDIHIYFDPKQVGDLEVNAFQTGSDIIIQKSLREGFGLTVTEAMWKGTPVIGGNCGGIASQIQDGINGFLVDDARGCAHRIVILLKNHRLARNIGEAGRRSAGQNFLMPRLLRDHLRLYDSILNGR